MSSSMADSREFHFWVRSGVLGGLRVCGHRAFRARCERLSMTSARGHILHTGVRGRVVEIIKSLSALLRGNLLHFFGFWIFVFKRNEGRNGNELRQMLD